MREDKERLTQQLMVQRRQHEEKLSQQKDSENQQRGKLLRLKEELEEKDERLLSCQRRCDIMQEQLSSDCAAGEEAARLREDVEKVQQEARELRRERGVLVESHGRALTKMEDDSRQKMSSELAAALNEQKAQNALHLREQMEEFRREVELELTIDREKNRALLLQYQRDSAELQEKLEEREQVLRGLQDKLQEERGNRVEESRRRRRSEEEETRRELQRSQQQEALQLSQEKAGLQLVTERNAELQDEVALLQETVRRECEEREDLTAALSRAQGELLSLRSLASHQGSSRSPPNPIKRQTPPGNKHFHLHSQTRVTLARSLNSPNTLRPSPPLTDKERGQGTDEGRARRGFESRNGDEKRREGTLPRLRAGSTVGEVKRKVSLATERKERL